MCFRNQWLTLILISSRGLGFFFTFYYLLDICNLQSWLKLWIFYCLIFPVEGILLILLLSSANYSNQRMVLCTVNGNIKKSPAPADLQFYTLSSCLVLWLCFNTLRLLQSSTLTLQRNWQHKTNAAERAVLKMTQFYHELFAHRNAPSNLCKNGEISIY